MFSNFARENRGLPRKMFWDFASKNPALFYEILYRFYSRAFWVKLAVSSWMVYFFVMSYFEEKDITDKLFKNLTELTLAPELCLSETYWWDDQESTDISPLRQIQLETIESRKNLESFALNWLLFNLKPTDNGPLDPDVIYGDSEHKFTGNDKVIAIVTKIKSAGQKRVKLSKYKFVHLPDKLIVRFRLDLNHLTKFKS